MSMQPPPYAEQSGYPLPSPKKRPRALWFGVGALLMVLGIVAGVAVIARGVQHVTALDAIITANGEPATVSAPAGKKRMLFRLDGEEAPSCTAVDGSGQKLLLRAVFGEAEVSTNGGLWLAFGQLDSSGDGKITLTCTPTGAAQAHVRVGAPVDIATLGGSILIGLGILGLVTGAGFLVLLITTILWVTRKPRQTST